MSDAQDAGRPSANSSSNWGLLLALTLLLLAYPLSVGPLARFGKRPSPTIGILYSPLAELYKRSPTARKIFDWYIEDVWGAK